MIYILIISVLIKKPFYLLRRQSFSFEIVSEFSNFMSRGGAFDSLFCPGGRVFVHNYCPGGRVFAPFESCPGGLSRGGMVLDEIDTCISASNHVHITQIVQVSYQMHIRIFPQKFQSLPSQSNPLIALFKSISAIT